MFPIEFADCGTAETLARVEAAHAQQRRSELDLILLAQHYASLHPVATHGRGLPGGEQARVYGGEGCPEVAEFAPAEFGAITGVSAGSAARFIGQCLALPFRFPLIWDRVRSGRATAWKARQIAQDCVNLSQEAAAIVDHRVADIIDTVTGRQLANIMKTAIWDADPEAARSKAEEEAKERGVWVGRTDNHGTTTLFVKAATGDVKALDATITQLAVALAATGDTSTLDQRRAKAAGLLADPDLAADLLVAQHLAATTEPTPPNATPAEADLAEANSAEANPAEADPAEANPSEADPAEADPAEANPSEANPAEADLAEADPAGANLAERLEDGPAGEDLAAVSKSGAAMPEPATHGALCSAHKADPTDFDDRVGVDEPDMDDEVERDTPHPSTPDHPLDDTTTPVVASESALRHNAAHDAMAERPVQPDLDDEADRDTPHPNTADRPLDDTTTPVVAFRSALGHSATADDAVVEGLIEPDLDDEADRDTPHPNTADHPLDHPWPAVLPGLPHRAPGRVSELSLDRPLDQNQPPVSPGPPVSPRPGDLRRNSPGLLGLSHGQSGEPPGAQRSMLSPSPDPGETPKSEDDPARAGMNAAARLELRRKIDAARQARPGRRRTFQTVLTIHITDQTLFAGAGTARIEGYGPVYTNRLEELLGHHRIVVRPVNDLHVPISVHSYEIPQHLRDQINLRYPVEQFPYGTGETRTTINPTTEERAATDLDHIVPYRLGDPSPQTRTDNLTPQRRFSHRLKTHGDWDVRRINPYTLEWTSPHGYTFHVDHNGTHHIHNHRKPGPPSKSRPLTSDEGI